MRGVETLLILALVASVACVGQGSSVSTDLHVGEPGLPIPTPVAAKHEGGEGAHPRSPGQGRRWISLSRWTGVR